MMRCSLNFDVQQTLDWTTRILHTWTGEMKFLKLVLDFITILEGVRAVYEV